MATFDINDVARRVQYTSTGQTGPFNFTFQVNASSELLVYIDDTVKTETTHYTVSLNADGTGSVTFGTATTSGELITIIGDQPLSRTTVFQVGQVNQPTTLETEFDNTLIRQQQIKEITDRSIQLKPTTGRTVTGSGTSGPLYFPYDTTVANNADRVLKFDSNGTSLELGSTTTNIDALAAIASDITTVSGISGNVTTVAGIASNVTSVASNASNINTVATNIANVNTVAGISSDVTAVAAIDTEIAALSGVSAADLSTVAGIASEIATVSGIDTEITTVSGISANVTTVAGDSTNIGTVAGISGNITTVAGIASNVTTVAGISSDVSTVAGISANVTTVAGDTTNIGTVASNISNVNTVATNISGVNSFGERYRVSASAPTTSLDVGDLYYDTTDDIMKVYGSSGWQNAGSSVNGTSARFQYDVSTSTTTITGADKNGETLAYDAGYVDVYLNGVKMVNGTDVTVTSGNSVVFATAIGTSGTDTVDIIAYGTFNVAAISTTSITSGTLGTARGGTGLGSIGTADQVLQVNAGGTALEYGKVQASNLDVSGNGTSGQVLSSDADGSFSWIDIGGGFTPTTASGTSQALDLGSYNFFNGGTHTGNTTLSFTNVPTEANWRYTFKAGGDSYRLDTFIYDQNYHFPQKGTDGKYLSAIDLKFKSDGTKMYIVDYYNNYVYQYSLSTAWNISTASYDSVSYTTLGSGVISGIDFKTDGTVMFAFAGGSSGGRLMYSIPLSTAWDISTVGSASASSIINQAGTGAWRQLQFKSDGTKFFMAADSGGANQQYVFGYDLSTAWDVSTISYNSNLEVIEGTQNTNGFVFNDDGTRLFTQDNSQDYIIERTLSTAYDLTTASFRTNHNTPSEVLMQLGSALAFGDSGSKLYVTSRFSETNVNQFRVGNPYTLTLPSSVQNRLAPKEKYVPDDIVTYEFYTTDGGTNVYIINDNVT